MGDSNRMSKSAVFSTLVLIILFAPGFVVKMAIRMIRTSVLKTADFDIRLLSPIEHADRWDASLARF